MEDQAVAPEGELAERVPAPHEGVELRVGGDLLEGFGPLGQPIPHAFHLREGPRERGGDLARPAAQLARALDERLFPGEGRLDDHERGDEAVAAEQPPQPVAYRPEPLRLLLRLGRDAGERCGDLAREREERPVLPVVERERGALRAQAGDGVALPSQAHRRGCGRLLQHVGVARQPEKLAPARAPHLRGGEERLRLDRAAVGVAAEEREVALVAPQNLLAEVEVGGEGL